MSDGDMKGSDETMRLQKFISRAGIASRRASEGLMAQGRVVVNGKRVTSPGMSVNPRSDRVEIDGQVVRLETFRWIMLNKPTGTLTTRSDPGGRPTVYGLLPDDVRSLNYVGRLDMDTEGLLILTNDGDAMHALLHPSSEIPQIFHLLHQTKKRLHQFPQFYQRVPLPKLVFSALLYRGQVSARFWWRDLL